jgi:hypothetical protein
VYGRKCGHLGLEHSPGNRMAAAHLSEAIRARIASIASWLWRLPGGEELSRFVALTGMDQFD